MYRVEEKTFAGIFALTFLIGVFLITGMFVFRARQLLSPMEL